MQTWIMIGLSILALGSLLVIARVSWRVRRLVTEAEKREERPPSNSQTAR
ncbi:MAG: hypothetical protein Ct9H300mP15_22410 [Gemmatimonadota bacterium]|nr:MAG: hypothetical protein Ct9H300mP15_22410 [Gemmatimonadota bacterium]